MKRIVILLIAILPSTCYLLPAMAQSPDSLYAAGDYATAAAQYEALIDQAPAADLYYNLGNAYYKQGEIALAILAYERCLRLAPNMKDAKYNLALAQSRITDNIADTQAFFISNWLRAVRNQFREGTWRWMSIAWFWLMLIGLIVFTLSKEQWLRKTAFYTAIVAILFSGIAWLNAHSLYERDTLRAEAIITQGIVNVKASPDRSGTDLFTVHEGTKVNIHETLGDWCNIHVGNNVGWILLSNLERI